MKELTKGYPAKVILLFTIPFMLGNIVQQLYFMVDNKIVSEFVGTDAFAAVGATTVIANTIISFISGMTMGFNIPVANCFGAQNPERMRRFMAGSIKLTLLLAVIFTLMGVLFIEDLLNLLDTPMELMPDAVAYIKIIIIGLVFTAIYNLIANNLRALGDSKTPLYAVTSAVIVNIGLDLLFVKVFNWGIEGAAYATIISQAVSCTLLIFLIRKKIKELLPKNNEWKLEKGQYRELLSAGLAMGLMGGIVNIGTLILQSAINGLGKSIVAAHTAARRVFDILTVLIYSFGVSMTTFCSQNLGAGRFDRIKQGMKQTLIMVTGITTFLVVICFAFGRPVLAWLASTDDTKIIDASYMYMKVCILFFYALGPLLVLRSSLQGLGKKIIPVVTSVMEMIVKILSALILVPRFEYVGVAYTEPISWVLMVIVLAIGYINFWKDKQII